MAILDAALAAEIPRIAGAAAWNGGHAKWQRYWREQQAGQRRMFVAILDAQPVGYSSLLLSSAYAPFVAAGIPEVSELVVAEARRGQGIATGLMDRVEDEARAQGHARVGLGVGLYADYGAAQRLYVKRGYVPDGNGATSHGRPVPPGGMVRVDDDLLLWFVRRL